MGKIGGLGIRIGIPLSNNPLSYSISGIQITGPETTKYPFVEGTWIQKNIGGNIDAVPHVPNAPNVT